MSIVRDIIENDRTLQTNTEILDRVKTVDGVGSGLDADLLDGKQGSFYLPAGNYTAADVLAKIKTVDGINSGLDADLVRGLPADFTLNTSGNGYQKLPSGLIIQWGSHSATGDSNGVLGLNFPIVFPNAFIRGTVSARANCTIVSTSGGQTTRIFAKCYQSDGSAQTNKETYTFIAIGY